MRAVEKPESVLREEAKLTVNELKHLHDPSLWETLSTPNAKALLNRIDEGLFAEDGESIDSYFRLTQELLLKRSDAYEVCIDSARHMRDAVLKQSKDKLPVSKGGDVGRLANALMLFKDANPTQKSNPIWRAGVVNQMLTSEIVSAKIAIKQRQEALNALEARQNEINQIASGKVKLGAQKEAELL